MINLSIDKVFLKGSLRYYISALAFPPKYRERVGIIYNFCRKLDDIVDTLDNQSAKTRFDQFKETYTKTDVLGINDVNSLKGYQLDNEDLVIIISFVHVKKELGIKDEWVEAMFKSMEMDLNHFQYQTLEQTLQYTYGVAEVVGLFMCKALELSDEAYPSARALGRSAQWINFIRDIQEDLSIGRVYFPKEDLDRFGLISLNHNDLLEADSNSSQLIKSNSHKALSNSKKIDTNGVERFNQFIQFQCSRFDMWVGEGESGYRFIPSALQRSIKIATRLDKWKVEQIRHNPMIVYKKKVNPSKIRMFVNYLWCYLSRC